MTQPLTAAPGARPLSADRRVASRSGEFSLACGDHVFSVRARASGALELRWETSRPLPASPAALPGEAAELEARELPDGWRLLTDRCVLRVHNSPLAFELKTLTGETMWGPVRVGMLADRLLLVGELGAGDRCYGLGEKPGYLDRRGRQYTMWNTDNTGPHAETADAMYQSIPFMLGWKDGRAAGLLFDDPGKTTFDLGATEAGVWRYEADAPGLRLFLVPGPLPAQVVSGYAALTGLMPLPPRWSLGLHQSRWSYESAEEVLEVARAYRERGIPADVIHLDIDYMDRYRVFTWDPERFADPAGLVEQLAALGFRAVTIVDPGVKLEPGYAIYDSCLADDLYVRLAGGAPFVGPVWPGDCLFPDFEQASTRAWWGQCHRGLVEAGIAGIWNDMNEPSVFRPAEVPRMDQTMPDSARHGPRDAELLHREAHNLYGWRMSQATREGLLALKPDSRPFVISRAGYAGIQRHAMVWLGDNHSIWSHLEQNLAMCLSMGLCGVAFVGPDVGGFSGDCTPELLVRWHQAGVLTPFFRNHSAKGTRRQEPWTFGAEAEALCREAIQLRYALLPTIYTAFWHTSRDGLPMMRALWLGWPHDPAVEGICDQFMFGEQLLVAPVTRPLATTRAVYFPQGDWVDFHTGEAIAGPCHRVVEASLATLPLYARAGSVLPLAAPALTSEEHVEVLGLRVVPGETLAGQWYDDDGLGLAHTRGAYNVWRFGGSWVGGKLVLTIAREAEGYASPTRRFELLLPLERLPRLALFNGEPVTGVRLEGGWLRVPLFAGAGTFELEVAA